MDNGTSSPTLTGVTSWAYHISMCLLVFAGITGNSLVIAWRCSRKETRRSLISLLIVSLTLADLLFCCHYLLQEVMLVYPVFVSGNRNQTFYLTKTDHQLCVSVAFCAYLSVTVIMLMAVAIALYSLFLVHSCRHGNRLVTSFVLFSWIAGLALGAVAAEKLYQSLPKSDMDLEQFSLIVVYGCIDYSHQMHYFPIIVTTVNAASSVLVTVVYVCLCKTIEKTKVNPSHSESREIAHLRIRLTLISGLNLLCWWPACILYSVAFFKHETVQDGSVSPVVSEPVIIFSAAVSAANPIIYTIASKRFLAVTRHACACCLFRRGHNEEGVRLLGGQSANGQIHCSCWHLCCRLSPCQVKQHEPKPLTEDTDSTGLFTTSFS